MVVNCGVECGVDLNRAWRKGWFRRLWAVSLVLRAATRGSHIESMTLEGRGGEGGMPVVATCLTVTEADKKDRQTQADTGTHAHINRQR